MRSFASIQALRPSLAVVATLFLLGACTPEETGPIVLSERPQAADSTITTTDTLTSFVSTRARIRYSDLETILEQAIPATHTDADQQKVCKRVLGIKLCGTARWDYTVTRENNVTVSGADNFVVLTTPMRFTGQGGISGDVAKVLALDALDFQGALNIVARLHFDLAENWCPVVSTQVEYQWTETPKVKWAAGVDFNVKKQIDTALAKQLDNLQERVNQSIDCEQFKAQISEQWRSHSIKLDLPQAQSSYLNIFPTGFAFSGIHTEADHVGIAFTLDAETIVQADSVIETREALPPLTKSPYKAGITRFDIVIHADYEQLQTMASPSISGKLFTESTKAGDVSIEVQSMQLSGNPTGLTIEVTFKAQLPGKKLWTTGTAFLLATPAVDTQSGTLFLRDIALSNAVDSRVYGLLLSLFNKQIVEQLRKQAVLDLTPYFEQLETEMAAQLSDRERTGGLHISAQQINVELLSVHPESDALAAVLRAEATLDIEIPITAINALVEPH